MRIGLILLLLLDTLFLPIIFGPPTAPKNIIIMVGDGMGFHHVQAGRHGAARGGKLSFEHLPYSGSLAARSLNYPHPTDSAASSTALATGHLVRNTMLSVDTNGNRLETLLEYYQDRCKSTGLVTTDRVDGATVAAFGAHALSRFDSEIIINDYLNRTRPNVVLGGMPSWLDGDVPREVGYKFADSREELRELTETKPEFVFGGFGRGEMAYLHDYLEGNDLFYDKMPHLTEMTRSALTLLEDSPDGFFLVVENELIDSSSHVNATEHMMAEVEHFASAVSVVREWIRSNPDTLLIVLSDHETGGMEFKSAGRDGEAPNVDWDTKGHSNVDVPIYGSGYYARNIHGTLSNIDVYNLIKEGSSEEALCADGREHGMGAVDAGSLSVEGLDSAENHPLYLQFGREGSALSPTQTALFTLSLISTVALAALYLRRQQDKRS